MSSDLTRKALGAALGISGPAVTKAAKLGMPTHSVEAARAWRLASVREHARARDAEPASVVPNDQPSYQEARRRMAVAEARRAELDLLERSGELVRADDVRAAHAARIIALREALLQLPDRMAAVLAAESAPERCHDVLQVEIHDILTRAAQR